jgi:hypothetical protein
MIVRLVLKHFFSSEARLKSWRLVRGEIFATLPFLLEILSSIFRFNAFEVADFDLFNLLAMLDMPKQALNNS